MPCIFAENRHLIFNELQKAFFIGSVYCETVVFPRLFEGFFRILSVKSAERAP